MKCATQAIFFRAIFSAWRTYVKHVKCLDCLQNRWHSIDDEDWETCDMCKDQGWVGWDFHRSRDLENPEPSIPYNQYYAAPELEDDQPDQDDTSDLVSTFNDCCLSASQHSTIVACRPAAPYNPADDDYEYDEWCEHVYGF